MWAQQRFSQAWAFVQSDKSFATGTKVDCISELFIEHTADTLIRSTHYENTPMQYTAIFHGCKNDIFS